MMSFDLTSGTSTGENVRFEEVEARFGQKLVRVMGWRERLRHAIAYLDPRNRCVVRRYSSYTGRMVEVCDREGRRR